MSIKIGENGIDKIYLGNNDVSKIYLGNDLVFESLSSLCFTADSSNSSVELLKVGIPSIANTAYSLDGVNWITFNPSTTAGTNTITLNNIGDKVYFRNDITGNFQYSNHLRFKMTGSIIASGNVNSLYDSINYNSLNSLTYEFCYCQLFFGCESLLFPPKLPAKTLSTGCYREMFKSSGLTNIPSDLLPAKNLKESCYDNMFAYCYNITSTLQLPANNIPNSAYVYMFRSCTSLTSAYMLPARLVGSYGYYGMFKNCTALQIPPQISAIEVGNSAFGMMFQGCTSLCRAPKLYANDLRQGCYNQMFSGCSNLLVNDTQESSAFYEWKIPFDSNFVSSNYTQYNVFESCMVATSRTTDNINPVSGSYITYYISNPPI